jgi:hypothetical protein
MRTFRSIDRPTLHRVPPIAETDDEGNLVNIRPAEITFTLLDEVRREYEAGECE